VSRAGAAADDPVAACDGPARGRSSRAVETVEMGASGRIRTCDTWYRKPVLYPLSYGGLRSADTTGLN
jgi:hypothetical protein